MMYSVMSMVGWFYMDVNYKVLKAQLTLFSLAFLIKKQKSSKNSLSLPEADCKDTCKIKQALHLPQSTFCIKTVMHTGDRHIACFLNPKPEPWSAAM